MKNLVVVFILMSIASCNPAKKLAKQQKQYQQVVDEYNKNHPVRIDTTTKYLQGETITEVVERTDTIVQYHTDTVTGAATMEYFFEKGRDIYHTRVDTITKIIVPTDQIELLKKLNETLTTDLHTATLKTEREKKWFWLFIIACIVAVAFITTTLKKR